MNNIRQYIFYILLYLMIHHIRYITIPTNLSICKNCHLNSIPSGILHRMLGFLKFYNFELRSTEFICRLGKMVPMHILLCTIYILVSLGILGNLHLNFSYKFRPFYWTTTFSPNSIINKRVFLLLYFINNFGINNYLS